MWVFQTPVVCLFFHILAKMILSYYINYNTVTISLFKQPHDSWLIISSPEPKAHKVSL